MKKYHKKHSRRSYKRKSKRYSKRKSSKKLEKKISKVINKNSETKFKIYNTLLDTYNAVYTATSNGVFYDGGNYDFIRDAVNLEAQQTS